MENNISSCFDSWVALALGRCFGNKLKIQKFTGNYGSLEFRASDLKQLGFYLLIHIDNFHLCVVILLWKLKYFSTI